MTKHHKSSRSLLRRVVSQPHRALSLVAVARALSRLRGHPHPSVRHAADACHAALLGHFDAEEQRWVDRIEALRHQVSQSTERVSVSDFGAVSPTADLSAEQMYTGRVVERGVGEMCRSASKSLAWSALLFHLIRRFRPRTCVELGCCVGISASFQASALRLNGDDGRLWTLEGAPALAEVARRNFAELELDVEIAVGRFQDTLDPFLATHHAIDHVFIDGHHDGQATLDYLERFLTVCSPRAVLVFDDISWSDGMREAWRTIELDDRIPLAFDCRQIGVCVLDPTLNERVRAKLPFLR